MGLDMRPMGKARPGFEARYVEIYNKIRNKEVAGAEKEAMLEEWRNNLIPTYETIKAPVVGRDAVANEWAALQYEGTEKEIPLEEFLKECEGYYVIELAPETDGVPPYRAMGADENVFRGEFLNDCVSLIGNDLVSEAWETKLADDALDYGKRLQQAADAIAIPKKLDYLREQYDLPNAEEDSLESQLHIVYSLARWLIFYGKNGHGYEADY